METLVKLITYIIAPVIIFLAIFIAFIDLARFNVHIENAEYVSGLFALAGVLLFFAALLYQVREYHLQIEELRKSVEAQTKSSEALEEQKQILLEQKYNQIVLEMIKSFNDFKTRNNLSTAIENSIPGICADIARAWINISDEKIDSEELHEKFARSIQAIAKLHFESISLILLKEHTQLVYNILQFIDMHEKEFQKDFKIWKPFLFSQLTSKERFLILLINLVYMHVPQYGNLYWGYYETELIMDNVQKIKPHLDYSRLNYNTLMKYLISLKQK